jgi:hypothetical protein
MITKMVRSGGGLIWCAAWVNGMVWLIHDGSPWWAAASVIVQPISVIYGAGHLMGAW